MTTRLTSDARLKQLRMALLRVERGRAHQAIGRKLRIHAVAEEAGVSAALIHNNYPQIAEAIREKFNGDILQEGLRPRTLRWPPMLRTETAKGRIQRRWCVARSAARSFVCGSPKTN